jgi:hypothetical protein
MFPHAKNFLVAPIETVLGQAYTILNIFLLIIHLNTWKESVIK